MTLGMTVAELLCRISSREISEWIAFYSMYPFGPHREDQRAGVIASMIGNVNLKKSAKPFLPSAFFPELKLNESKHVQEQSMEEQLQILKSVSGGRRSSKRRKRR